MSTRTQCRAPPRRGGPLSEPLSARGFEKEKVSGGRVVMSGARLFPWQYSGMSPMQRTLAWLARGSGVFAAGKETNGRAARAGVVSLPFRYLANHAPRKPLRAKDLHDVEIRR